MANMVIPNAGKLLWLEWMVSKESASFGALGLSLYTNNYTPVATSIISNFTAATFTGGAPKTIPRSDWDAPGLVGDVAYIALPSAPSWICTAGGPQTCYGWFLYDLTTSTALAAQRFTAPRVMDVGAEEKLDPFRIGLKTFA